jgi:hypothetical protein
MQQDNRLLWCLCQILTHARKIDTAIGPIEETVEFHVQSSFMESASVFASCWIRHKNRLCSKRKREAGQKCSPEAKSASDRHCLDDGNLERRYQNQTIIQRDTITYPGFPVWLAIAAIGHPNSSLQEGPEAFDRQGVVLWSTSTIKLALRL